MITIDYLMKYNCIVYYGLNIELLDKYYPYFRNNDFIVDSDPTKQERSCMGKKVNAPTILKEIEKIHAKVAVVILPLAYERDIYTSIRKIGYQGDIYSDDMIIFDKLICEDRYVITNGQYTIEKHTQILISLLKEHGISNVVASPGTCNMNFVKSVQGDSYFRVWSCVDERSAAYMACGMAQTTGEPVVLSCTGATASRNYMSALTEAFYSHLPVIAITSSRDSYMIGNGIEQVTDRIHLPRDVVKESVELSTIHTVVEKKYCELKVTRALLSTKMNDGGPVHINLITHFEKDFTTKTLPKCKKINLICNTFQEEYPPINADKIALYIRPIKKISKGMIRMIEQFCEMYNAVVLGDHLSNYSGKYFIDYSILTEKEKDFKFDLLIYFGTINRQINIWAEKSWRISKDGKIEDSFMNQECHFDMEIEDFFAHYTLEKSNENHKNSFLYDELKRKYRNILNNLGKLPFSNVWVASQMALQIPINSVCYFGIFSTLRNWSYFEMNESIECHSTVGGYGIDGTMSAMIGASLLQRNKLFFGFFGDLSFYYDMNVLGNRHIGNNVRIMVFNNNGGNSLLHNNGLPCDENVASYVGARNHFEINDMRINCIEAYASALGFTYLKATNKEEFCKNKKIFIGESTKPILFELIYDAENDFEAVDKVLQ